MSQYKTAINPGFVVKHRLSLCGLSEQAASQTAEELGAFPWMDKVKLDAPRQVLKLAYDASSHNIDEVIAVVEKHGGSVSEHWWSQLRLGWQRQIDQNIHNNSRHEAHCCNKSPKR
ncbi:hypothetical protein [Oceanobacter mangrovi]|uniref:hypothetical protein n=1 Tax=Oceanobacter mangrovi TaxID=2862510 RepID=UPI001C8D3E3E|nr:hypothetical protein [Oceanobacter mangrovi]